MGEQAENPRHEALWEKGDFTRIAASFLRRVRPGNSRPHGRTGDATTSVVCAPRRSS